MQYKIRYGPYYKDFQINTDALAVLLDSTTNIVDMMHTMEFENEEPTTTHVEFENNPNDEETEIEYSTSFMFSLPNKCHKLQIIKNLYI